MLINAAEARPAARGGSRAMARPCRLGTAAQASPQNDPLHERRYSRALVVGQEQRHMVGRVSHPSRLIRLGWRNPPPTRSSWPGLSRPSTSCHGAKEGGCQPTQTGLRSLRKLDCATGMTVQRGTRMGGWAYITTNRRNGTLYVGVASDLPRRVYQHLSIGHVPGRYD